jgi:hypothetical protein
MSQDEEKPATTTVTKPVPEFEDYGDVDFDEGKDARAMPK